MNISILSPLIKLKIHSQHIHKFFMHVLKGFVMKFARPMDSTKLCYIHDITTGIFMLKLNKFHHTGISILVFFTMHTFICSNFQMNLCKSIQQDINHFRSNQSNLSNTHSITLILYHQLYQYGGDKWTKLCQNAQSNRNQSLCTNQYHSYILEPRHSCISD